jgi:hypothetical protein
VMRAAVLRESGSAGIGQWAVIQAVSPTLRLTLSLVDTREPAKLERDVGAFSREPNGGLIVAASASGTIHRELIVTLAARHRLPAIYPYSFFVAAGGLISYGPDLVPVPPRRRVRRPHPQGRETRRSAGAGADQVRDAHQPQNREGSRPRNPADPTCPRRRGDRVTGTICCVAYVGLWH